MNPAFMIRQRSSPTLLKTDLSKAAVFIPAIFGKCFDSILLKITAIAFSWTSLNQKKDFKLKYLKNGYNEGKEKLFWERERLLKALCLTYVYVSDLIWHSFCFWHVKNRLSWSSPLGNLYCNRFILLIFVDCQRFENGIIEGNLFWANNSGPALVKWRYTPQSTDNPGVAIRCFFTHSDGEINVIRRTDINNPVVQNSEIQGFTFNGKVQSYLDSTDPTL